MEWFEDLKNGLYGYSVYDLGDSVMVEKFAYKEAICEITNTQRQPEAPRKYAFRQMLDTVTLGALRERLGSEGYGKYVGQLRDRFEACIERYMNGLD